MANKKQAKAGNSRQSPYEYIRSGRARSLPLGNCYINVEWKEAGLANILVSRKHITGNITYGIYLVDLLWKGVKDTDVHFNEPEERLQPLFNSDIEWMPIDYNTAHNIIYGAEAFASEYGIKPHPDFELSRMILEEDDDRIPIIDIEFGKDGKPFIVTAFDDLNSGAEQYDDEDDEYDDPSSPNQTSIFDNEWQHQNIDPELTPLLSGWTRTKWEDFIKDVTGESPGDPFVDQVLLHVFDACFREITSDLELDWPAVMEKSISQDLTITSNAVQTDDYEPSQDEQIFYLDIYFFIGNDDPTEFRKQYKQRVMQLLAAIERWPDNKQLYNALQNMYIISGEDQKLEALLETTVNRFPDYLFGLVNYANHMLRKEEEKLVPSIMKRAYNITDLYPHRSIFHVSEIFSLYQVWFEYFLCIGQLMKARHYRMLLKQNIPPDYDGMKKVQADLEKFDTICVGAIQTYLAQAAKDPEFKEMMIDTVLRYGQVSEE